MHKKAIKLADQLLDSDGKLSHLPETIEKLKKEGYFLDPKNTNESDLNDHFLITLTTIHQEPLLVYKIQNFGLPLCDPELEEMIQIILETDEELTERHIIWAVLSALLTPLRQSVGSCFATAPAILVHAEQPKQFLEDMQSLLSTGLLTRVFGGTEYTVPISPSPGLGSLKRDAKLEKLEIEFLAKFDLKKTDLHISRMHHSPKLHQIEAMQRELKRAKWHLVADSDHLLLKVWEYTLASFADVKTEFSRWNLYSSLGLHPDEKGGLGELIYTHLEHKLSDANEKLEQFQAEYEIAFDQVRATERLMRNATSEHALRRLKAEHQSRLYHMNSCEEMRNKYSFLARNTAEFFSFFIETIIDQFQLYFQEIYDAEMQEVKGDSYDDSPAGFRLLFKHGRAHVRSWTFIYNKEEYIYALKEFFVSIENTLREACTWEEGKEEISHLITAMVHHIRTDSFLISAFHRLAKAHRVPLKKVTLEDLDDMEKKPWAYTSGGTLSTLMKTYFRRESPLSEEARWVESPQDLLIFLFDTLKMLPPRITDLYVQNPKKRMLMTSPTHAFSLLPGQELFRKGWEDSGFTYTWVRDQLILPAKHFYAKIRLEEHEQLLLLDAFAYHLPSLEAHALQQNFSPSKKPLSIPDFAKKLNHPLTDAFLFESLPLIQPQEIEALQLGILAPYKPITRRALHDHIAATYSPGQSEDIHEKIANLLREKKHAPPRPCLFADSNWETFYFSFVVNPATLQLELWATDKIGLTGGPLRQWTPYLDGTLKEPWSLFFRPYEYSSF